jgi:hypothetical protein
MMNSMKTLISEAAEAIAVCSSSGPLDCSVSPTPLSERRTAEPSSSRSGKRSVRKSCRRRNTSGTMLKNSIACCTSVGRISSAISTKISTAEMVITAVAAARLSPIRCSLSATGSRK